MSAPDPKVVALLAGHIFHEEFGGCTCNTRDPEVGYDPDEWVSHVAQVLADAGIGDVGSRNVAMDLIHEADEQRERAERAEARVAAVVEPVLALADCPHGARHHYATDAICDRCEMPSWVEAAIRIAVESTDVVASGTQAFSPAALARIKAEERERIAQVERDRDDLLRLAQSAIQAHRDLHRMYGNTAACGGGIGGAAMTQHCGVTCGYFEKHERENERWHAVEAAFFARRDGDPDWADRIGAEAGDPS